MKNDHLWFVSGASLLALSVVVLLCILGVVFFPRIRAALTPRPEQFTELYFEHHLDLPKSLVSNQIATVSATVHNLEHQTMTYPLDVYAEAEDDPTTHITLFSSKFTLQHDEFKTIDVPVTVSSDVQRRIKVVFSLPEQSQSIHFWVNVAPLLQQTESKNINASPKPVIEITPAKNSGILSPL